MTTQQHAVLESLPVPEDQAKAPEQVHATAKDSSPQHTPAEEGSDDGNSAAGTEVFVGGLPSDATEEAVTAAFAKVGTVLSMRCVGSCTSRKHLYGSCPRCAQPSAAHALALSSDASLADRLTRRKRGGECKGFAFVRFPDQSTAERACAEVTEVSTEFLHHIADLSRWGRVLILSTTAASD